MEVQDGVIRSHPHEAATRVPTAELWAVARARRAAVDEPRLAYYQSNMLMIAATSYCATSYYAPSRDAGGGVR